MSGRRLPRRERARGTAFGEKSSSSSSLMLARRGAGQATPWEGPRGVTSVPGARRGRHGCTPRAWTQVRGQKVGRRDTTCLPAYMVGGLGHTMGGGGETGGGTVQHVYLIGETRCHNLTPR